MISPLGSKFRVVRHGCNYASNANSAAANSIPSYASANPDLSLTSAIMQIRAASRLAQSLAALGTLVMMIKSASGFSCSNLAASYFVQQREPTWHQHPDSLLELFGFLCRTRHSTGRRLCFDDGSGRWLHARSWCCRFNPSFVDCG